MMFYVSLILPWAILEGETVVWNYGYIFSDMYPLITFMFLGIYTTLLTIAFLIGWLIYSILSLLYAFGVILSIASVGGGGISESGGNGGTGKFGVSDD